MLFLSQHFTPLSIQLLSNDISKPNGGAWQCEPSLPSCLRKITDQLYAFSRLSLLGIDRHALFGAYGMRRALLAAVLIVTTHASVFSEGGSLGDLVFQGEYDYPKSNAYLDGADIDDKIQEWYPRDEIPRSARESQDYNENLEEILQELAKQNQGFKEEDSAVPGEVEIELQKTKELPKETAGKVSGTEEPVSQPVVEQPLVAQKKGQNEFVSFVEPVEAKQTK
ncbi:hypothetical protein OESDEN_01975 [Oesophagostomum dentatum]|uniref:Uncharacterized protein n=1 Tax=Oesophagostomum dentatum TaxID=61180 RepID=A0A0B1TQE1_OESDE|nr:hypothetical protein OESDEN_01975 [Oesophagostomum dentatum]